MKLKALGLATISFFLLSCNDSSDSNRTVTLDEATCNAEWTSIQPSIDAASACQTDTDCSNTQIPGLCVQEVFNTTSPRDSLIANLNTYISNCVPANAVSDCQAFGTTISCQANLCGYW